MKKITVLLILLVSYAAARACTCPPLQKLSKEIADSYDVIFLGTVDSVGSCEGNRGSAYFVISQLFKGETTSRIFVNFDCVTDCRMQFKAGETWLIYAEYARYGDLRVNYCGRSRKHASDVNEDFSIATHGITFGEELDYIKLNFGVRQVNEKDRDVIKEDIPSRELIHPGGKQTLLLLAISLIGMLVIWYVVKKLWK
jgi:hypothetical protein